MLAAGADALLRRRGARVGARLRPVKTSLNCTMPALVNSTSGRCAARAARTARPCGRALEVVEERSADLVDARSSSSLSRNVPHSAVCGCSADAGSAASPSWYHGGPVKSRAALSGRTDSPVRPRGGRRPRVGREEARAAAQVRFLRDRMQIPPQPRPHEGLQGGQFLGLIADVRSRTKYFAHDAPAVPRRCRRRRAAGQGGAR